VVSVAGVCSVVANGRHQLTGIELWVPDAYFIHVEQSALGNFADSASRPLGDLRRFGFQNGLNQPVKTTGTVVLDQAGRHLYLQDGRDTLFALSRQPDRLTPGDRVEITGFPGHERGKFLLREAVFRKIGHGPEPAVLPLSASAVNLDFDGLLASATGTLLNVLQKDDHARLLIHSEGYTFEADMEAVDAPTADWLRGLQPGSVLALTGVYEVQTDEYNRPATFLLLLRSWNDIQVLKHPSWWTLTRLLTALAAVVVVLAISVTWGILLSRKNQLLRQTHDQLVFANQELESFSYSVSHDLRAPLRSIDGFSRILLDDCGEKLDADGRELLGRLRAAAQRMTKLIDDLLALSRHTRAEMHRRDTNLSELARTIADELKTAAPARAVEFCIAPNLTAPADAALMRVALENLLGNAWKFTAKQPSARIEFGETKRDGMRVFFVRDNGAGFNMQYANKLFVAFQRLHSAADYPGTGIGLATVQRIIHRHGGRIWAEGVQGQGATFYFTLRESGPAHLRL
ncbi:MAG TPA: ATP-binding protein, partial [Verrucomicrobiae bacterium]